MHDIHELFLYRPRLSTHSQEEEEKSYVTLHVLKDF